MMSWCRIPITEQGMATPYGSEARAWCGEPFGDGASDQGLDAEVERGRPLVAPSGELLLERLSPIVRLPCQDEGRGTRGTRNEPLTVATFRSWRGSRYCVARGRPSPRHRL